MIENASVALQRQYHRFLAYHCFRSGLSPNNAYTAMIPVYGEGFLHLNNFKRHYTTFRKDDFAIDSLLEPEERVKRKKKKRVIREKPRPLPLPLPGGGIPPPLEDAGEGQEAPGSVEQAESESEDEDDDDADMSGGDVDLNDDDSNDVEIIDLEKEEEENEKNNKVQPEDDDDDSQDSVIIISDHGHHYETFHDSSSSHTADKEAENEDAARQSGDDTPNDDDGDSGGSSSEGDSSDEEVEATQPEGEPQEETPEAAETEESAKSAPKVKAARQPKASKPASNVPCRPKLTNKQNRTLILDCFKANYSLRETQRSIRSAYGNAAYSGRAIRKWYERFQSGDLSLKELSRSVKGRLKLKPETLQPILEQTPTISTKALAKQLDCCPRSIVKALFRLGYQFLVNKWVKVLEPTVGPREQQKKIVVSDAELRQYKADHPDATIADFALHFKIPRLKLGSRLRDLGFYYPKWPKRAPPIPGRKPGRPKREEATFVEPENPEERASYIRKTRYGPLRTVYSFVAQAGPSESGPSKPRSKEKADGAGGGDLLQEAVSFSHALSPGTSGLTAAHSTPHNTRGSLRRKPNTSNEAQPPTDTYPLNTSQIFPPMYHYPTASSSSTSSSVASHYNPIGSHLGGGSGGVGSGVTAQHANYFGSYLNAPSDHPQQQQQQQQHLDSSHLLDLFGSLNVPLEATTQQRTHYHHSADGRY